MAARMHTHTHSERELDKQAGNPSRPCRHSAAQLLPRGALEKRLATWQRNGVTLILPVSEKPIWCSILYLLARKPSRMFYSWCSIAPHSCLQGDLRNTKQYMYKQGSTHLPLTSPSLSLTCNFCVEPEELRSWFLAKSAFLRYAR